MWSDNKAALGIVFEQSPSAAQKALVELAANVGTTVAPWNEPADTLCDHKSRGDLPSVCDLDQLIRSHRPPLRLVVSACDPQFLPICGPPYDCLE